MTLARPLAQDDSASLPDMPGWITHAPGKGAEDVAFLSGAALSHLHVVIASGAVPQALLRDRLALRAAEVCVGVAGRVERAGDLRDAVHLMRPGDLPGPAGEVYLCWQRAVARPVSARTLTRALPGIAPDTLARWRASGTGAPVARAAGVLETVLREDPRAETAALILANAALAQGLGWDHLMPLLEVGLKRSDLRADGDDLRLACHRAVIAGAIEATRLAADVTRRAARLRAVAPKLRAKGAGAVVEMFLTQDAVAPAAIAAHMSDRAARRICDRLVTLGAVQELTGRETFRLYGV